MPDVVTCLLQNKEGKILILKRSDKVGTYRGFWSGISGYIEKGEKPIETALKEIREETKITDVTLIKENKPISFTDNYEGKNYNWNIFSFLFKTEKKDKVQIDWEHTEYRWILPSKMGEYKTVPRFKEIADKTFR